MSRKQPKFFTQNIPSTQKNTEFLLNLLEDLLNSNTLSKSQKNKLDHILDRLLRLQLGQAFFAAYSLILFIKHLMLKLT